MALIHILPVTVQNKIAAGEVIERPASVVKELTENAIDAGAKHIAIDLEDGGHRLIRIADDGAGMTEEDLIASMQRHATSKIHDVDDIFRIGTFGFRGEALPSIGAVSRMRIATATPGAQEGHELQVEGGRLVRIVPCQPGKGTRVEVRDIFFNTPARRKFLAKPTAENTRAAEVLTRLALGNPTIGFRLRTGERLVLALEPARDQMERIAQIWGGHVADKLVPFGHEITSGLAVNGFFVRPPASRRNSRDIYVLVNKRWIRFYGLARAAADAFQGILPPREYPFAIINIDVDPSQVDVNAHPAKEEVRFEQESIVISGVRRAIRNALEGLATVPTLQSVSSTPASTDADKTDKHDDSSFPAPGPAQGKPSSPSSQPGSYTSTPATRDGGMQKAMDLPSPLARPSGRDFSNIDLAATRERLRGGTNGHAPDISSPAPASSSSSVTPLESTREDTAAPEVPSNSPEGLAVGPAAKHRILGQAGGRYILVDGPDGLLLVDPHALHERWNFDRLVEDRKKGASSRKLLMPVELRLSPVESAAAEEAIPALAEFGFEFSMPEADCLAVTAAPSFLPAAKLENLIRQVLADAGEAGPALEAARDKVLASLACRSSVLLGKSLPEEEMLSLLDNFFNKGQLPTCPHGRPTAISIGWDELARRFGRQ